MLNISNYYERLVIDELWKIITNNNDTFNQEDIEDIACVALNKLPCCYVHSLFDKGSHLSESEHEELEHKVHTAVTEAVIKIRASLHSR